MSIYSYLTIIQQNCLQNKYTKWYINIINNAVQRTDTTGYVEKHHILPKCFKLGGEKDKTNLVELTAKEHFICHQLLVRMVSDKSLKIKLSCAALLMCFTNGVAGKKWTPEQKEKLKNRKIFWLGRKHSKESKQKIKESRARQILPPITEEQKERIRQTMLGRKYSQERIQNSLRNRTTCKNKKWWNNGIINRRIEIGDNPPGEDWVLGRKRVTDPFFH